jgi:hypothetical protein
VHPPRVILYATPRIELVGADPDVIDTDDLGHLLEAVDVSIDARKEVPDADRAPVWAIARAWSGLICRPRSGVGPIAGDPSTAVCDSSNGFVATLTASVMNTMG